jgi:hypothetical protein
MNKNSVDKHTIYRIDFNVSCPRQNIHLSYMCLGVNGRQEVSVHQNVNIQSIEVSCSCITPIQVRAIVYISFSEMTSVTAAGHCVLILEFPSFLVGYSTRNDWSLASTSDFDILSIFKMNAMNVIKKYI